LQYTSSARRSQRLTAEKGDPAAVGRPDRVVVVARVGGQPQGRAGADLLHVDVEIILPGAIPRECYAVAVGRKRRRAFETGNGDELDRPKRLLRLPGPPHPPREKPATSSTGSRAAQTQRRRGGVAAFTAAAPESDSSFTSSSATFRSSMCWKRRSGFLRRHRAMILSSSCGISLRSVLAAPALPSGWRRESRACWRRERRAARGQHFVEHGAERENVAARIHRLALRLLGRHVGGSAYDGAFFRPRVHRFGVDSSSPGGVSSILARPKSSTFTPDLVTSTLRASDPVYDPLAMRRLQGIRHLDGQTQRLRHRHRPCKGWPSTYSITR